jgi:general transcription factor 3C polypeptide 3 (transcription factor C subunit 4)
MKLSDTAVKHPEVLKWNNINKRYAPTSTGGSSERKGGAAEDEVEDGAEDDDNDMDVVIPHPSTLGEKGFEKDGRPQLPTKSNPVIITIYGQICIAAKSYQSAICALTIHYYAS